MNGTFKLLIQILVVCLFANSCQIDKEFEYNDKFPKSTLVIYAFLNEKGIKVEVRKTVPPLDIYSSDSVPNAKISLYETGVYLFDLQKVDLYNYISPETFTTQRNKEYYITASAEGFKQVQSDAQKLPDKVLIDNLKYKLYAGEANDYTITYIRFTDPTNDNNAYYVSSKIFFNNEWNLTSEFIDPFGTINDKDFNGQIYTKEKELNLRIYDYDYEHGTDTIYKADSARIYLYSLSPNFLTYMESFSKYDISYRSPEYEQPFQVFSNIDNGYGIIGAYCVDSCTLVFNKDSI